ncbi:SDR family NAD(P)-dependent oxidoreductase [Flavobacterium sp. 140616W15]|uniref:SDR family NAD(P)-dependent oxidoreductase n=1 Tax=Flavobacterium sp. 140616W15 TaxID=2478552 RepID=UPI000F0C3766|nr:SDR family NAD(P)-dependent oxidoreductase [Flavobacterium sp. 140616W15]AYN03462.1 SDR family oxidoreductase [Flavobacterium sp. 140616W15]
MKRFENKVAFITGGNSGIGKVSALAIAKEGAAVMITDLSETSQVVEEIIKAGGKAAYVKCDVSKPEEVEHAVNETVRIFGRLDVALNNAGIVDTSLSHVNEKTLEEWNKVIAVNLSGVFYGMKYQIAQMRKQGGGSIVNIGSVMSQVTDMGIASYVSSKHGVVGLTKAAALENGTENIRVNIIGPGYIETPILMDNAGSGAAEYLKSKTAMKRLGKPEEIAKTFLFLASDDASYCTGAYLPVDGGYLIQ